MLSDYVVNRNHFQYFGTEWLTEGRGSAISLSTPRQANVHRWDTE